MLSFSIVLTTLAAFSTASPLAARTDSCPVAGPNDKAETFDANGAYAMQANTASSTPNGYSIVARAYKAAANSPSYITYKTLTSYDPAECAKFCDSYLGCNSFDIYVERDPSVTPTATCQNPASTANVQCSLFRAVLDASSLTNTGQYRQQFHVVIAASNLYTKNAPPAVTGYDGPYSYSNKAIVDPTNYLTYETFPNQQTYDPNVCAGRCAQITNCKFFDAYIAYQTGKAPVFTCAYYKQDEDPSPHTGSKATNSGYTNNGITYSIGNSNGYALM